MPRLPFLVVLLFLGLPSVSRAQEPAAAALRPTPTDSADTLRKRIPPTKWKKGALFGGATGGLSLGLLGYGLCRSPDAGHGSCLLPTLGVAVVGAIMGGTLGALVGGQFWGPAP